MLQYPVMLRAVYFWSCSIQLHIFAKRLTRQLEIHYWGKYCYPRQRKWPSLWSSGQSIWLQIQRSRVRFSALPDFLRSRGGWNGFHRATTTCRRSWWQPLRVDGVACWAQRIPTAVNLVFLDRIRYFFIEVAAQSSSQGWVDPKHQTTVE
jgi:hypothetical protein